MAVLTERIPDPDVLLALPPEELGPIVLRLACEARPGREILLDDVETDVNGRPPDYKGYPQGKKPDVKLALSEAWNWLRVQGIIVPTGNDPWHHVSRRGKALLKTDGFKAFAQAAAFPKALLHPAIADAVWLDLARGDFETAIFRAYKTVEIAVREASDSSNEDHGDKLMRRAFNPKDGPLTDTKQPDAERKGLADLFAGAAALYRNSSAHRTVTVSHHEAQEIVMLASHLLRIVDARKSANGNAPRE